VSLTRTILGNRHAVWALAIAVAVFGALAYSRMPMQLFPDTAPPLVNVVTIYPGVAAADVAGDLSRPLEEEFASLEGIVKIRSSSQDNLSLISMEFRYDRDVDLAAVDVQNAIARIRGTLPRAIREPQVLKFSTNDRPVITVGAAGKDLVAARQAAEDLLAPQFQRIKGVAAVDVFGGAVRAVLVEIDQRKLEAYRIPLPRVLEAIRAQNTTAPAGRLRSETTQTSYRVEARSADLRSLAAVPLFTPGGETLRLSAIATLRVGSLDDDARFSIDGTRAIALQVFKTDEANTVQVVREIQREVQRLGGQYPALKLTVGEESATFTETSISNLLGNIWQALLLASLVIFLFIGRLRASLVAVVSMPLSYGVTFALMKLSDTEFNMVTLSAVILAVGMVVDASVVVLENINRKREEAGLTPAEAAVAGADEVRLPVLAGVATTAVVLVPLLFTTGFIGKTFGPLALTLLFAFSGSLMVALILVPVLSLWTGGGGRLDRFGLRLTRPFQWLMDRVRAFYLAVLGGALRHRLITIVVALGLLGSGLALIRKQGMEMLPKMDSGSFFISLETPSGTSLERTQGVIQQVEAILRQEPAVTKVQAQVGFEEGMRSFAASGAQGPTQGFITVTLTPRTGRTETIWQIEERVRRKMARVPGIRSHTVRELGSTAKATTSAPIVVRLSGADPLVLDRLGQDVLRRLKGIDSVVQPVRSWRIDQKRVRVLVDALRAGPQGLSPASVATQMQLGSVGVSAGDFYGRQSSPIPVWVRYRRPASSRPDQLLDYPVAARGGGTIPLRAVARLEQTTDRALVTREDQTPTLEVSAFVEGRALSFVIADVEQLITKLTVPRGYDLRLTGEKSDLNEAKGSLAAALAISLVAVYLLLVAQLRSFVHPLTIMMAVPLSLFGVGIALKIAGQSASMPVMLGLILLVGMVVNNAIILLDFIRRQREQGLARGEAILASVHTRFRPIMMTSLSTIVGMIPLAAEWALGAERFSPLATAVIGGMTAATFLSLVIVPVIYSLFDDMGSGLARLLRRGKPAAGAALILVLSLGAWPSPAEALPVVKLDVEQSFKLARASSHALAARAHEVTAAGMKHKQARGRFLPRLDLSFRYSRLSEVEPGTITMPQMVPGQAPQDVQFGEVVTDVVSARVSVTQPLFNGFGLLNGYRAAGANARLARRLSHKEEQDLRLQVEEAYFNLFRARELARVAKRSVVLLEVHLAQVRTLEGAGRATPLDRLRVASRVATARARQIGARSKEQLAGLRLNAVLGLDSGARVALTEQPNLPGAAAVPGVDALHRSALQHRPDLLVARDRVKIAKLQSKVAGSVLWPQVALHGGYTLASPNERHFPPRNEFNGTWDLSVSMSWTLWEWGAGWYGMKEAQHRAKAAASRVALLEQGALLDLDRQRLELLTASEEHAAALAVVQTAEQALSMATTLFRAGRALSTEVLDREAELASARASQVASRVKRRLALARLRHAAVLRPGAAKNGG
jgi:multidrug efflux pump subunit AcrB/outer membrane protein TolC